MSLASPIPGQGHSSSASLSSLDIGCGEPLQSPVSSSPSHFSPRVWKLDLGRRQTLEGACPVSSRRRPSFAHSTLPPRTVNSSVRLRSFIPLIHVPDRRLSAQESTSSRFTPICPFCAHPICLPASHGFRSTGDHPLISACPSFLTPSRSLEGLPFPNEEFDYV